MGGNLRLNLGLVVNSGFPTATCELKLHPNLCFLRAFCMIDSFYSIATEITLIKSRWDSAIKPCLEVTSNLENQGV